MRAAGKTQFTGQPKGALAGGKKKVCLRQLDEWRRTLRSLIPITDDSSSQMTGSTSLGLFSSVRLLTGIQSLDLTGASGATAPADRVECVEFRLGCFSRSLIVDGAGCWYNSAKGSQEVKDKRVWR